MIGTTALGPTQSVNRIPNIGALAPCDSYRLSENDMTGSHFVNYSWDSTLELIEINSDMLVAKNFKIP
jgi:hypothetical protein